MTKSRLMFRLGAVVCVAMLAWCSGAPIQAQASDATAEFPKGLLPQPLTDQITTIVMSALKAALPATDEGAVAVVKLDKNSPALIATVAGQKYVVAVFRPFLVEALMPGEVAAKEFYVRTTEPWKLKDGVVVPADTYLVGMAGQIRAFDAAAIAAQDDLIARSEAFSKAALDQARAMREAKTAGVTTDRKSQMDALTKRATDLAADITQKEAARKAVITQIGRRPPKTSANGTTSGTTSAKDASGKLLWQWNGGQITFYDNLEQCRQELDKVRNDQKALQQKPDTAASATSGPKEAAIRATLQKHRRRIIAGEALGEDEMRQDYEAALGEAVKTSPAAGDTATPAAKPPIQTTPARKR